MTSSYFRFNCCSKRLRKAENLRSESKPLSAIFILQHMSGKYPLLEKIAQMSMAQCYAALENLDEMMKCGFSIIDYDPDDPAGWMIVGSLVSKFERFSAAEFFYNKAIELAKNSKDMKRVFECRRLIRISRENALISLGGDEDIAKVAAILMPNLKAVIGEGLQGINFKSKYCMGEQVSGIIFGDVERKKILKKQVQEYKKRSSELKKFRDPEDRMMKYH